MGRSIDDYKRKRDFKQTPEPPAERIPDAPELTFVVHRHEARRLHYDLRLSLDGVLKCWAVPRGFSYDIQDKRLAVQTEDHPLKYETFEGVIPKGQYGAGTMTIWDRGWYRGLQEDLLKGIEDGKLELVLGGQRLRGEWHLVRTNVEKAEWILFKARDRYEIAASVAAGTLDYTDLSPAPKPEAVKLMRPRRRVAPFSDPDWLFEMEFAGRRVHAGIEPGRIWVQDRRGRSLAESLPGLLPELDQLRSEAAWMDGVLVALDDRQRPSEEALNQALADGNTAAVQLYVFDLLYSEDFDVRGSPLRQRKEWLRAILPPALTRIQYVDHVVGEGEKLAQVVTESGLLGVIAKKAESAYMSGASADWRRVDVGSAPRSDSLREALDEAVPGPRVPYTNMDKVFFPEHGLTKGDMITYYEEIADTILPYLKGRPLHLNRFPDGIHGKSFYQKNAPEHLPDWVETIDIASEGKDEPTRFIVCNDAATLLVLANLGSIDLHPWMSRCESLESPDWAILDLDPKGAPFFHVVKVARLIGSVLRGMGIRPYLKTSGKTGLHIYVPLVEGYSYEHSRLFTEGVARYVARELSDISTVERVVGQRGGKVYIDFLQNHRGQTVVPPYVVRPVEGAQVSTPLDWDELNSDLSPADFHIKNVPDRVRRLGDLFPPTLTDKQDLMPAIDRLQEMIRGGDG